MLQEKQLPSSKRPIILVGGETGGHITPLIAIGEQLAKEKRPFICLGGRGSREEKMFTDHGWRFVAVRSGKWRRYWSVSSLILNLFDLVNLLIGCFQAARVLLVTRAPVIFSKGGPVSLPVVISGWLLFRAVIIHESDSVMGLTNRIGSRFARRVLTAFGVTLFSGHDSRYTQVGIPIRASLRQAARLKAPRKGRPLILVIGGIQGAEPINRLIRDELKELLEVCDVVHSTGDKDLGPSQLLLERLPRSIQPRYKPFNFIGRELPYYFQTADLVISRSSATTIAEGALFGKAMILIPLPGSAGDHQKQNASVLSGVEAAIVLDQKLTTSKELVQTVSDLLADAPRRAKLGQNLGRYFNVEGSLQKIITIINEES
ncbi:MAG: UDP-N-acetylglucosamine--N-acetylmuramyl-(pentapeptide) pyrophosphoryl-undecaprenol N-acetylglucosamine transferase [Patescibacteria group bacterium]